MTDNSIVRDGSIKIMKYLGYRPHCAERMRDADVWFNETTLAHDRPLEMRYDTSFDALMPVVKKIKDELVGYCNVGMKTQSLQKKMELALYSMDCNLLFKWAVGAIEFINNLKEVKA